MSAKLTSPAEFTTGTAIRREPNLRQRILVVEDEPSLRKLTAAVLTCSGYHVDTAEDGATAWDSLQLINYDLLITDHTMPKLTGVALLEKLHAADLAVPAILVSGNPPITELSQHPELQIEAVLLKPYTLDELLAIVKNVLYATSSIAEQPAPPPNWPGHMPVEELRA